ncbi:glycosyltransferase [Blastomonas aquatica]|uniref:Glycosyl transferase family 1 n=1 Tax=Blastomonas aquatica TaxID=1510276 RepID=A0ABQ1JFR9_9SPHN|nr:glycosyltransferase [Blastomonas aquatica]GGB65735.1 glycosyl transferase family 1 [Blastomonas aquatica]
MRIGIISHLKHPIAEPFAGGLEMHTFLLAKMLRLRGHDVILFATAKSDPDLGLEAICSETAIARVGVAEAGDVAFFREHHAYLTLMNGLRTRNFDVIHNNSLHYLPVSMADGLPMPMITTLHTPPFCWLESGVRLSDSPNHSLVGVSQSIQLQWAHIRGVDAVIPNGIDLNNFAFRLHADADPYLVWYGRIVPEKGLHLAMDAARQVGLPLRIAGPAHDEAYFRDEIQPRLGADARHEGHLAHAELANLIGGARAFLCSPMWDEPYGLVVAEALACGVPVAAFARGAIPEIIDAGSGVLATPGDAGSLALATLAAMRLDRRACRARAFAICDAEKMIDGYEGMYAHMIERMQAQVLAPRAGAIAPRAEPYPHHTLQTTIRAMVHG